MFVGCCVVLRWGGQWYLWFSRVCLFLLYCSFATFILVINLTVLSQKNTCVLLLENQSDWFNIYFNDTSPPTVVFFQCFPRVIQHVCGRLEGVSASVAIRDDEAVSYRVVCRTLSAGTCRWRIVGLLLRYAY